MANAYRIRFSFVSRTNMKKSANHIILGTQIHRPKEFASQTAFNTNIMWGILNGIIDICYKILNDGEKRIFMKEANKPISRLYRVPDYVFKSEDPRHEDLESTQQVRLFM